jgi:two-component system chemotaxis response regulator CheB
MGILERVMSIDPIPMILACDIVHPSAVTALRGLDAGAVDVVQKPRLGAWGFYQESGLSLVQLVRAAEGARPLRYPGRPFSPTTPPEATAVVAALAPAESSGHPEVVVIGASMGGPAALKYLLARLPHDAPGMVIVQHLPAPFTPVLAAHLGAESSFTVREAQDGDRVAPGVALIAPGGRHVEVQRSGTDVVVRVRLGTAGAGHYSSIDSLLVSAARKLGPAAIGVLLSGMGGDGALGLSKMRQAGSRTVVQDEDSSVHFELPRSAIQLGAAGAVLSLRRIAAELGRLTAR